LKISREEELRNPEKSLDYAQRALQESRLAMFDSAEIKSLIQVGANLCRLKNIREAIKIGERIVEMASKHDMLLEITDGRSIMAVAYAQVGDFDNSSKLYFENLKLFERLNEKRLIGRTFGNIGVDFSSQQSYEKAMDYVNKALKIAIEINDLPSVTDQFMNLAIICQIGYNDPVKARSNYAKALKVAQDINDLQQQGTIMLNVGILYKDLNKPDSTKYFLTNSLEIFKKVNNQPMMANSYISLGRYFFDSKDIKTGKALAMKGLEIGEQYSMPQTIYDASDLLHEISLSENDTANAYKFIVVRTQANDSLFSLQNKKALFKLEFQYNQEKKIKEQKLKQLKSYFILGIIILSLLSGLIIVFLFYSRQKIKIKNFLLGKEKMEAEIKFKSKEVSINLMALLKKNELIGEISRKLAELEKSSDKIDMKELVIKLNREIKLSSDDKLWQEFSVQFKETNSDFYDHLLKMYPDLTQTELKLCAFLRLNMTTKEIADLTGQSVETLGKARYRLRKKFGITNSDSNLVTFLTQM